MNKKIVCWKDKNHDKTSLFELWKMKKDYFWFCKYQGGSFDIVMHEMKKDSDNPSFQIVEHDNGGAILDVTNFHYIYTSGHYTEDSCSILKYPEYWEFSK